MNESKLISVLGLAQKAGKIVSGDFAVQGAIKSGKAKLLIVANDSSPATKKEYQYQAENRDIPIYYVLTKEQLGGAIGKVLRAAVAVNDNGFVKPIVRTIEE